MNIKHTWIITMALQTYILGILKSMQLYNKEVLTFSDIGAFLLFSITINECFIWSQFCKMFSGDI